MTWLTENPVPLLVVAGLVEAVLAAALFVTRRGRLLVAMGGVAAVAAILALVEWLIVTPREHVHTTLFNLVAAVERQNLETALAQLSTHPETQGLRNLLIQTLPTVVVRSVHIQELEIEVERRPKPAAARTGAAAPAAGIAPSAIQGLARARFRAWASVQTAEISSLVNTRWTLLFVPEGGRWLLFGVESYEGPGADEVRSRLTMPVPF